jgi:hypothetical protein
MLDWSQEEKVNQISSGGKLTAESSQARVLKLLSLAVLVSTTATVGSGGLSISRGPPPFCVVSNSSSWFPKEDDSPTFRLLGRGDNGGGGGIWGLYQMRNDGESVITDWFNNLYSKIMEAFHDGRASPRDVNQSGQTLLHLLMAIVSDPKGNQ